MKKGTHPTNRPKISLSARRGAVMHQDRKSTEYMPEIPTAARKWEDLPPEAQKALMNEAVGKSKRLRRKLG